MDVFTGTTRLLSSSSISDSFHNPYLTSSTRPVGPRSLAPPASTELTEQYGLQWRRITFCAGRFIHRASHWQGSRAVSVVVLASMYAEFSIKVDWLNFIDSWSSEYQIQSVFISTTLNPKI